MQFASLISVLALLAAAMPARAEGPPEVLQATSRWHLDYAKDYCRLARQFGGPGRETFFYIEQYEPGKRVNVLVAGPDIDHAKIREHELRFGPGGGISRNERILGTSMPDYGDGLLASGMTLLHDPAEEAAFERSRAQRWSPDSEDGAVPQPVDPAAAAPITWFSVMTRKGQIVRLDLGSMAEPITALNTCAEELVGHWGIDLAQHRGRTRVATPATNPGSWLDVGDYPTELVRKGMQGLVMFRLGVDAEGKPTGCAIQQSTRPAEFDKVVCRNLIRKARFDPALDAAGKPMPSFWRSSVRFEIPD